MFIGILNVETDWDFGFILNEVAYVGNEERVYVRSVEDLKNIQFLGPFGSPFEEDVKICEFQYALSRIIDCPDIEFNNLSGNRGVHWIPLIGNKKTT